MELPISVLLTLPNEPSQLWFAREAASCVPDTDRVFAEATERGLLVRGATELDLELVCHAVRQRFGGVFINPPNVEIIKGPPRLEPYYLVTVTAPVEVLGDVIGDLSSRHGHILAVDDVPSGKSVKAEVPVIQCFGYAADLRVLTKGGASFELTFVGYRPYHGGSGPEPKNVA